MEERVGKIKSGAHVCALTKFVSGFAFRSVPVCLMTT